MHTNSYFLSLISFFCLTDTRMLATSLIIFFLLAAANLNVYAHKSYSQYQLWRLQPTNNQQLTKLIEFSHIAYQYNINFWSEEFRTNAPVSFTFNHFT